MSEYSVEKNIPIPPRTNTKVSKYPYSTMEIGDSFHVKGTGNEELDEKKKKSLNSTAHRFGKDHNCHFVIRNSTDDEGNPDGFRVFRDELPLKKSSEKEENE